MSDSFFSFFKGIHYSSRDLRYFAEITSRTDRSKPRSRSDPRVITKENITRRFYTLPRVSFISFEVNTEGLVQRRETRRVLHLLVPFDVFIR